MTGQGFGFLIISQLELFRNFPTCLCFSCECRIIQFLSPVPLQCYKISHDTHIPLRAEQIRKIKSTAVYYYYYYYWLHEFVDAMGIISGGGYGLAVIIHLCIYFVQSSSRDRTQTVTLFLQILINWWSFGSTAAA